VGTLAGGIAHDLSNLLAPIVLAVDLLKMSEHDKGRLELLGMMEKSAQRAKLMVGRVLTFARGVDGKRAPVPTVRLLEELQEICRETFPKNLRLSSDIASDLWPVRGDSTQLHQVLLNLCVNARDAMPKGGDLRITARNLTLDDQYSSQSSEGIRPGDYVSIEVKDSGCGISPENLDKIFEPFFTTKDVGRGTGLGLSTSLAIIKSHAGHLRVCSDPGHGTSFVILLPAETAPEEPSEPVAAKLPGGDNELVLLVEDEPEVAEMVKQSLEAHGYRVELAGDGAEAVARFALLRSDVSLVLTDLAMPVMDGMALLGALRAIDPEVRVVAASGLGERANERHLSCQGVPLLIKPYTTSEMLTALRQARRGATRDENESSVPGEAEG
jgi:CheY-like chemotaxis protein